MKNTLLFLALATLATNTCGQTHEDRWAEAMDKFRKQDAQQPTAAGGVVFVGSSSIRLWDLPRSFPDLAPAPLNRGFGGSHLEDSIRHAELLILKHKPQVVVVYAGDNDIAAGKSVDRVVVDFTALAKTIRDNLSDTRIVYIAIKPSTARWRLAETMAEANRRIAELCAEEELLSFVDIWKPMLGDDGKPRVELLRDDGLHLTDTGYELWTELVVPLISDASTETPKTPEQQSTLRDVDACSKIISDN